MLLIRCPWCGDRDEVEFRYGGQADVAYPADPHELDDAEWGKFLFVRANPMGALTERWVHTAGCRRWFSVVRDTATNEMTPDIPRRRESR
ncbi:MULTISPECIES: sarcosine oxidase subunit delta [unclassified Actinopolyspora]|uniref:sarcosine oxidase subunit delta n=1 Tax=unclassified Actinopolyspora TaxID=2639451 RepID=UPI0013F6970F|nr:MULTISPECIES: sarcosine oxidase subunit delta [unclassified Actinopolyspora]NHD17000.1 sarcosine oxidase subunit delta [Actinopolyspora sp. BKK2]NHE76152.1 sarcosine oxidase subunit delta [Actinopolyspora sp. BKK1]